ncbi:MAG: IS1096 element passenger TnpR family protein [Bacteroidia bacterium]
MAIYRFKVSLEDNEDIFRDIDIKSSQTFEDFHICIQEAFKFDNKHSASFFMSDDYWRKNQEITYKKEDLPLDAEEIRKKVDPKKLMGETKIAKFIEQPHQRFIYVFDSVAQWSFLIEMIKITEENPKTKYPAISRSAGTAPKQYKTVPVIKEELSPDMAMAAL